MSERLKAWIKTHRWEAHQHFFGHRHEYPSAPFHREIVEDFWCDDWAVINLGFRECGKTTLVEEDLTLATFEGSFRNCVIIGAKEALAAELLTNVKVELENNDALRAIFGDIRGDTWQQTRITTVHGYCIQAVGRDQSLRGTKHREWRPDLVIVNDFEDDEELLSPDGRRRTLRWVLRVLLPACDRARRKIRIYDTVRDAESVPMMLIRDRKWRHRLIPITHLDEGGDEVPSWPQHPSLTMEWIEKERETYVALGAADIWEREYMVNAATTADRAFTPEMIRVEPVARTWQAVYAMIDPARTVKRTSATTGWAVWSWVKNRLIVWEAGAKGMLPDEIIDLAFRLARDYEPIWLGIEETGLNEWVNQPIRAEIARRGQVIPYRAVNAPRGKIDFIRGLQPFFANGEAVLAHAMPELRDQLLAFPTGRIDAPNALAYALSEELKPGRLIYDGFSPQQHVAVDEPVWGRPLYLAGNAVRSLLTAALMQVSDGKTRVFADWVMEGDPGQALERVAREAAMQSSGQKMTLLAGRQHWDQYRNVGLVQAARQLGIECRASATADAGREQLRRDMARNLAGEPVFGVAPMARWTLNALAGGFCRPLRGPSLGGDPEDGPYRVLMEGIEAALGLFAWGADFDDEQVPNFAVDRDGRRYRSALPARMRN